MMKSMKIALLIAMVAICAVNAGTTVSTDIATDTVWTKAGMPYHLQGIRYVLPGASLTIEPGVVIASYSTAGNKGSLVVCRDADIYINGTSDEPVIFTSANDVATWTGSVVTYDGGDVDNIITMGDPKTGTWRAVCTEWGSLAVLGKGYISATEYEDSPVSWTDNTGTSQTNVTCPSAMNRKRMEGTVVPTAMGHQEDVLYGGDDDNDNSGSIQYVSFRYGGFDLAEADELNGLSLGALGRATDVHHIDIMNNVDDGIEIWGGTVQVDHVNIWNIGDDSFDFDEGWRGSAQYGLIVQGYSQQAKQGSGMGDNAIEHDGAEEADIHPMTTVKISNFTVVGQPGTPVEDGGVTYDEGSDAGCAFRDNARVQYDSCLWMDGDDGLIKFDNADGDGARGYDGTASDGSSGLKLRDNDPGDGTLNWKEHWTVSYNTWKALDGTVAYAYTQPVPGSRNPDATPNGCSIDFEAMYEDYLCTDLDAPLCNITNSFLHTSYSNSEYNNIAGYAGSDLTGNTWSGSQPIKELVRGAAVYYTSAKPQDHVIYPVEYINPLPDKSVTSAGAFDCYNWIAGWTAASAYGMTSPSADLDCSGTTNLVDFSIFAGQWLN